MDLLTVVAPFKTMLAAQNAPPNVLAKFDDFVKSVEEWKASEKAKVPDGK
jgi:hypothetical protein